MATNDPHDEERGPTDASGGRAAAAALHAQPTHPAVARALAALDRAGVAWLLLRGSLAGRGGDIDLLVDPEAGGRLAGELAAAGFHRIPAIGHGGHRFFRAYDEATDAWLTLDVVTDVAFGAGGWLELPGVAGPILGRRVRRDEIARPDPDDAFWLIALHDLLDRSDGLPAHGPELARLRPSARPDGPLGAAIDAVAGGGAANGILGAIDAADPAAIGAVRTTLRRRWLRSMPVAAVRRRLGNAIASRLRKPHTALRRRGIDVAVLGPDGAGKSTIAAALRSDLPMPSRTVYLGLYGSGLAGARRLALARRVARLWRGWLGGLWHRLRGRLVIYDRHALDIRATPARRSPKARVRRLILTHAIPAPALTLVLDVPGEVLYRRKGEHDPATLEAQRAGFRSLAGRVPGVEVVDANRDPDAVRRDVIARIWRRWTATTDRRARG